MRKVGGHVLQPIQEHFQKTIKVSFPKGWIARSRCVLEYGKQIKKITKELQGLETRVAKRLKAQGREQASKLENKVVWHENEGSLVDALRKVQKQKTGAIQEETVYAYKKITEQLVRTPKDKCNEDGLLL